MSAHATKRNHEIDACMTAHRSESKYLVTAEQARTIVREVSRQLDSHRHRGEGANQLPAPRHYVTTIYFDTASRALYGTARESQSHIKLRAKEYYDLHPDLTETATDPRELVRFQSILWLELKSRDGVHTTKRRLGLPKRDAPTFFARGEVTAEMIAIQEAAYGPDARHVLDAVAKFCAAYGEPLRADCLVNYRRLAWQDSAGELRITLDSELAYYSPPADLWHREWALLRSTLGNPVAREPSRVLEIKLRGDEPTWLRDLLRAHAIQRASFSKFEAASSAVHG
jgi:hypothetical protein